MKPPLIHRLRCRQCDHENGATMVLVAVAMVAIIAMAALSIDVITLYLAREEAQRSADAAALAAAKVLSVSGFTGNPSNSGSLWSTVCGGSSSIATEAARAVANQNAVGGLPAAALNVSYSAPGGSQVTDCTSLTNSTFRANPVVTVQIQQTSLPTLFSRMWGRTGNNVSATATAEAFNPANSSIAGLSTLTPVQPRCVKPWVVPNLNPRNPDGCTTNCGRFVDPVTGTIINPGISLSGGGASGTVGETFWLMSDCQHTNPSSCNPLRSAAPKRIQANLPAGGIIYRQPPPNLLFLPNQVGTTVTAVSSCSLGGDDYEQSIAGCDAPINYQCGVKNANAVDLSRNPDYGPTTNGVSCLIHEGNPNTAQPDGQDSLSPYAAPSAYPFQIQAGSSNPLGISGTISNSSSIVALPIYDIDDPGVTINPGTTTAVTFVGFLQVFINAVDAHGNINVTVLNVTGCGNDATPGTAVAGSSPVPVRLITPP